MNNDGLNTEKILAIIEPHHPRFLQINEHFKTKSKEDALGSYKTYDLILDFSILKTKEKHLFLKELNKTTKAPIISDLSLAWPDFILKKHPQVVGGLSLVFFSPTSKVEYFAKTPSVQSEIQSFLKMLNLEGIHNHHCHLSFHYPRIISMIINEAYFALEEKLANPEDIDQAMKFGVNYPLGPIEWGQKIGLQNVLDLLQELSQITEDPRYRPSTFLKLNADKSNLK